MFCKHEWELLSEMVTESKFEVAMRVVRGDGDVELPGQLCDASRKHIQVFACTGCGKLKRFVENI